MAAGGDTITSGDRGDKTGCPSPEDALSEFHTPHQNEEGWAFRDGGGEGLWGGRVEGGGSGGAPSLAAAAPPPPLSLL